MMMLKAMMMVVVMMIKTEEKQIREKSKGEQPSRLLLVLEAKSDIGSLITTNS